LPQKLTVNLELKSSEVEKNLIEAIANMDHVFDLMVSSFDARPLVSVRRQLPHVKVGLINSAPIADPLSRVRECGASALSAHWRLVGQGLVDELRTNEIALYVWTVNGDAEIREMADLGVHAIITDVPRRALDTLRR
jgi:glycerophosphoryl diester phosphodiesterase